MNVCHLFISPGHNYFGHQGQPAGEHPIVAVKQIECVAGHGIRGDRFFDYKPNYSGQITFFAMEVIEELERELNLTDVAAGVHAPQRVHMGCRPQYLDWHRV